MKETGYVRRMDDLGRIAIPLEVRRHFKLGEADQIELFIGDDDTIILKPYNPKTPIYAAISQVGEEANNGSIPEDARQAQSLPLHRKALGIRNKKPPLCKGRCPGGAEGLSRSFYAGNNSEQTTPQSKIYDFCQLPLYRGAFKELRSFYAGSNSKQGLNLAAFSDNIVRREMK